MKRWGIICSIVLCSQMSIAMKYDSSDSENETRIEMRALQTPRTQSRESFLSNLSRFRKIEKGDKQRIDVPPNQVRERSQTVQPQITPLRTAQPVLRRHKSLEYQPLQPQPRSIKSLDDMEKEVLREQESSGRSSTDSSSDDPNENFRESVEMIVQSTDTQPQVIVECYTKKIKAPTEFKKRAKKKFEEIKKKNPRLYDQFARSTVRKVSRSLSPRANGGKISPRDVLLSMALQDMQQQRERRHSHCNLGTALNCVVKPMYLVTAIGVIVVFVLFYKQFGVLTSTVSKVAQSVTDLTGQVTNLTGSVVATVDKVTGVVGNVTGDVVDSIDTLTTSVGTIADGVNNVANSVNQLTNQLGGTLNNTVPGLAPILPTLPLDRRFHQP